MGEKSLLDFGDSSPGTSLMHDGTATAVRPTAVEVEPDFSGWASKYGLRCSDGRTIENGAFEHQDGERIPLVWQHGHASPENVLGHVILEHRAEGPYCYGYFNTTTQGKNAKELVKHEDVSALSIFANSLVEKVKRVSHGIIREVSLVLAGANPGALIDNISVVHGDGETEVHVDEAIIYTGLELEHEGAPDAEPGAAHSATTDDTSSEEESSTGDEESTIDEVYETLTDDQKGLVHYMVGQALESTAATPDNDNDSETDTSSSEEEVVTHEEKDENTMGRNVFEQNREGSSTKERVTLSHDAMQGIAADAVKRGSLKEAVEDYAFKHGIDDIDVLFPDARNITDTPEWDKRRTEWVGEVLAKVRKSPFSRIKSIVADITHEEARARGYVKGTLKKEEFFGLTKRVTTPSTIYKKQKLDRDDILDITDFDVVLWLKGEMRLMLEEEVARAILIGDGRAVDNEDKVKDPAGSNEGAGIRSILHDDDLYAASVFVDVDGDLKSTAVVDQILESMQFYKGSGVPTFYTTLPVMTQMLLARDDMGRRFYRTGSELASELGVDKVVAVEPLEEEDGLVGIIVNLQDYTVGADRGGETSMFDDFDIDYNQYKYLLETRASGALTKIRSAIIVRQAAAGETLVTPAEPTFDPTTSEWTITDTVGVTYRRSDTNAAVTTAGGPYAVPEGVDLTIYAVPNAGYFFRNNVEDEWTARGTAGA
jgi:phage head maturation protease